MSASKPIFRQAALDRLSSPEQLDRVLTVARPGDWLAFGALAAITVAVLIWSVAGRVSTRVSGNGILVAEGGAIFAPVANGEGMLVQLLVAPGDRVSRGQRLARIAQPDLEERLASARALVAEDAAEGAALRGQVGDFASARARNSGAQRALLEQQRADAQAKVDEIAAQYRDARDLLARGIVTRGKVSELADALAAARQAVTEAGSRVVRLEADEISARNSDSRDVRSAFSRLSEAQRQLHELAAELDRRQWVTSPVAGRVVEIKSPIGSRVNVGNPVIAVENGAASLQLVLYLPPGEGKRVRAGMRVNISPSVAKREEYGTVTGRIVAVSEFPATAQAMAATLQNDQLVKDFSAAGAPIAARVLLDRNPATTTGYAWAGGSGPETRLTSGTLATAEVTVERQAPIHFALPFLKGLVGS